MPDKSHITGIILAGGKSTRMGTDKAMVEINGKPMIDYAVAALSANCEKVVISSNHIAKYKNLEIWKDEFPLQAPMIGIYSCLKQANTNACFFLSCDMPLVNSSIVKQIISSHRAEFDITLPMHKISKTEPLCAIYSKSALSTLERLIEEKNFKLQNLIGLLKCNVLKMETIHPEFLSEVFSNINTTNDLNNLRLKTFFDSGSI